MISQEEGFTIQDSELKSLNSDGSIENDDGIGFDSNKIGEIFFDSRYKTPLNIEFLWLCDVVVMFGFTLVDQDVVITNSFSYL